ncbi:hypothetical protein [Saccharospirillum salsuginis]|uniref:Uncharacterized protein n=1 Tax=Saccharospirillum salsuginis TaxID=418750 RepID=A0A918NAK9_9GAMM|nr:hypothetical protein [Saccharospirillum salsuginis]GGX54151.1 hypothetical protein GCM10007392_21850 [Saccharospirillum salsuginis]
MTTVPHYRYFKPTRIDILPHENASYSTNRIAEDHEIRYGFGHCSRINRSHIEVVEIDLVWLGVVFHIVKTSETDEAGWAELAAARDDIDAMKRLSRDIVLAFFRDHPERQMSLLERIHQGSFNQGRLDMALGTVRQLDPSMDLTRLSTPQ